jgi:hydrogenase expression/formation protein HypC
MRVVSIEGFTARCEAKGVERDVNLFMLRDEAIVAGDIVTIHLGYARQKISEAEADLIWELYDEILAAGTNAAVTEEPLLKR